MSLEDKSGALSETSSKSKRSVSKRRTKSAEDSDVISKSSSTSRSRKSTKKPGKAEKDRANKMLPIIAPVVFLITAWLIFSILKGIFFGIMGAEMSFASTPQRIEFELKQARNSAVQLITGQTDKISTSLEAFFIQKLNEVSSTAATGATKVLDETWSPKMDALTQKIKSESDSAIQNLTNLTKTVQNQLISAKSSQDTIQTLSQSWNDSRSALISAEKTINDLFGKIEETQSLVLAESSKATSLENQLLSVESSISKFKTILRSVREAISASENASNIAHDAKKRLDALEQVVENAASGLESARNRQSVEAQVQHILKVKITEIVQEAADSAIRKWNEESGGSSGLLQAYDEGLAGFVPRGVDWASEDLGAVIDVSNTGASPGWNPRLPSLISGKIKTLVENYYLSDLGTEQVAAVSSKSPGLVLKRSSEVLSPGECFPLYVGGALAVRFTDTSGRSVRRRVRTLVVAHPREDLLPGREYTPEKVQFWGLRREEWEKIGAPVEFDIRSDGGVGVVGGAKIELPVGDENLLGFAVQVVDDGGEGGSNNSNSDNLKVNCIYRVHAVMH